MPDSGSTTGTPISVGVGVGAVLAQPLPYTLLSLGRYAKIMGIPGLHFWSGATPGLSPEVFPVQGCDSIWWHYDWQDSDKVSRLQLAQAIYEAEQQIATVVGFYPAPVWIAQELHNYPRPYLREYYGAGLDTRGQYKGIDASYGRYVEAGQRAVTLIGTATVVGGSLVYSDEDSDGFEETATVTVPTTLTSSDRCSIKLYHTGHSGEQEWEIRPVRNVTVTGGNVVIVADSWLFVDPDLYEQYPTSDGMVALDMSTPTNFVGSVEVYYEYSDTIEPAAVFYTEPYPCTTCGSNGSGCEACEHTTQDGCIHVRNASAGILVPTPATYDATSGAWTTATWDGCREPDLVKLWYKAGDIDRLYLRGSSCDPLSFGWAKVIAYLATARLERPLCHCGNVLALSEYLRDDLTISPSGVSKFVTEQIMSSPFGYKRGEVHCWNFVSKFVEGGRRLGVAVI